MLFNIPQFIDKEDKIVGPFTAKQIGWMFGGGTVLLVLWNLLDLTAFLIASVIVAGITGALAFYRPYNQSLIAFIFSSITFMLHPKMYIWNRLPEKIAKKTAPKKITQPLEKKIVNEDKIGEISKLLDTRRMN